MFYCDECKNKHNYPESIMLSVGQCEICGITDACYDVPSSHVPQDAPEDSPDIDVFIIDDSN